MHVNTSAIHKVNKDQMLDMLSRHWDWYLKKKIVSGSLKISNYDRSDDRCVRFKFIIRKNAASCYGVYLRAAFINISALRCGVYSRAVFDRITEYCKRSTRHSPWVIA